jgi:glycosyltransferase involved in cell wall biosynthesis
MTESLERSVFFVVPDSIDDPLRVSGGNVYDRYLRDGLREVGWDVRMLLVPATGELERALSELPDDSLVIVDGLIAVRESQVLAANYPRLRMIVLAHMVASIVSGLVSNPSELAELVDRERAALRSALRVITTSEWTRTELVGGGLADASDIVVARPGTSLAEAQTPSESGRQLLCVGVVAPHKGQDILVDALGALDDLDDWTATFVGSVTTAPAYIDELTAAIDRASLAARVSFTGPLAGRALDAAYANADLVVVPSRAESFGMVIAEALARGIPVVAARVGGVAEALSNRAAGLLVSPDNPTALAAALREWSTDPGLRAELAAGALAARENSRPWSETVSVIESVLVDVSRATAAVPV